MLLDPDDTQTLIAYARHRFAEERYPLSPELRPAREAIAKVNPKTEHLPPSKPPAESSVPQRKKRRR